MTRLAGHSQPTTRLEPVSPVDGFLHSKEKHLGFSATCELLNLRNPWNLRNRGGLADATAAIFGYLIGSLERYQTGCRAGRFQQVPAGCVYGESGEVIFNRFEIASDFPAVDKGVR